MSSGVIKTLCSFSRWQYFLHSLIKNRTAKFCIVFILLECVHVCVTGVQVGVLVFTHPEVIWHVQFKCPVVILYFSASSIVLNERASPCRTGSLQWSSHFSDFLLHPLNTVLRTCQTTSQDESKKKERLIRRQWAWPHTDQDCLGSVYILGPLVKLWSYLKDPKDGVQGFAGSICFPQHLLNVST